MHDILTLFARCRCVVIESGSIDISCDHRGPEMLALYSCLKVKRSPCFDCHLRGGEKQL